jgi:WD40 repeat protein
VELWDATKGELIRSFLCAAEDGSPSWSAWAADGERVAFATDRAFYVWRTGDGSLLFRQPLDRPALQLTFVTDGDHLVTLNGEAADPTEMSRPAELILWDLKAGRAVCRRRLPSRLQASSIAVHPSGRRFCAHSGDAITIWNVGPWDDPEWEVEEIVSLDFGQPAVSYQFSSDGRALAVALRGGTVRVLRAPPSGAP